jgi:peptidoglycan/xylan/chitin deacetylase (PgdA/CDA1 family)
MSAPCRLLLGFAVVLAAGPAAQAIAANTLTAQSIPVLCYHRFGGQGAPDAFSVTPEEFAAQLDLIQAEGFTPISLKTLSAGLQNPALLPAKPVVITADDGYKDFLKVAQPLLAAKGFPAALFVYPAFVGARAGLSRKDLASLQASGVEIGSHSDTHAYLTRRPAGETPTQRQERLTRELKGSREKLRAWSGGEVIGLSYPYGLWDQDVAAAAQAAGYELMFTVDPGSNGTGSLRVALKRNMILRGTKPATFRALLTELPLLTSRWEPAQGARVKGPLTGAAFSLDPEQAKLLVLKTLAVARQNQALPLRFDAKQDCWVITLDKPWQRGTDLLIVTAQDAAGRRFRDSRLVVVDPSQDQKGTPVP